VGELERRYLNGTFAELCRIESPSGRERRCAERVIAELRALGVSAHEDEAGALVGSDCGNLLARIPAEITPGFGGGERLGYSAVEGEGLGGSAVKGEGLEGSAEGGEGRAGSCLLLCAHLDTPPLERQVEPVLIDGSWANANDGLLGARSKAAVAVLLALARHVCRAGTPAHVELLFTVDGERALGGARALDLATLRSSTGYAFDHASPIGGVVLSAPSRFRVEACFHGASAAGVRSPQPGGSAIVAAARAIAAMPLGAVYEERTVGIDTISGNAGRGARGERCSLVAEVSAPVDARAEALVGELVERVHEAANLPECECDVDVTVERSFAGYRLPATRPAVQAAETALRACGFEPERIASSAGSDANALIARGLQIVNLANGIERSDDGGERVSAAALEAMLEVALALLEAVEVPPAEPAR
jgi:tripeptide aminopeptidase